MLLWTAKHSSTGLGVGDGAIDLDLRDVVCFAVGLWVDVVGVIVGLGVGIGVGDSVGVGLGVGASVGVKCDTMGGKATVWVDCFLD